MVRVGGDLRVLDGDVEFARIDAFRLARGDHQGGADVKVADIGLGRSPPSIEAHLGYATRIVGVRDDGNHINIGNGADTEGRIIAGR